MNVQLPTTGCNILNNATMLYNYSPDNRTRSTYTVYDGVLHLSSVSTSVQGYNYTGTCLVTGDLVYKPEYDVVFHFFAFSLVAFCFILVYLILFKRFLK